MTCCLRALTLLAVASLPGLTAAAGEPCVAYDDFLRAIGNAPTEGSARSVAMDGTVAYLADGDAGFTVLDLADPTRPSPLATLDSVGIALWLVRHGNHVLLTNNAAELQVIDVTDPVAPTLVTTLPLPGSGQALALRPPLLYVAAGNAGLLIIDVANPDNPVLVSVLETPGTARGVSVWGDVAAVADQTGVAFFNVALPQQPVPQSWLAVPGQAYGVDLTGEVALVAAWNAGLVVIDAADPAAPVIAAQAPIAGATRYVVRKGNLAYTASGALAVVDVSLPFAPRVLGSAATTAAPISVTLDGPLALVPTADGGLDVMDADPATPPPVSSITPVDGIAFGVDTRGPITAVGAANLDLFDHTDPTAPLLLGSYQFDGTTSRLIIKDDLVLLSVASALGRVLIIDIADPAAPSLVTTMQLDGFVSQMSVRGDLVYMADFFYGGLFVVDLADPERPDHLVTVPTASFAQHLVQVGSHLIVGTGGLATPHVQVFDLADPRLPVMVDDITLSGVAVNGLASDGTHLYVAHDRGSDSELLVLDASDPAAMSELGALVLLDELHELEVDGSVLYAGTHEGFVHVIDVSDPTAPRSIGQGFLPDSAFVLALSDRAVHAAATDIGLALLPLQCAVPLAAPDDAPPVPPAADPFALSAYPNPFNPSVAVSFTLTRNALVTVTVYDIAGRRVADLFQGELTATRHTVTWDGRDRDGRAAPSGVYLARVASDGAASTTRLVLAH
jgi:hypothetical protein